MTRMRTTLSCLALSVAAFATGCVSVRAHSAPDANLASVRTYAFQPAPTQQKEPISLAQQQIRASLERNLAEKGLVPATNANPDVLIAYHTIEEQKTDYYGYGWGFGFGYWDGWGGYPDVVTYTEGTLIVDLIDPRTNRVLWRGTAQSVVNHPHNPNPEKIDKAVSKLMTRYPSVYAGRPQRLM